MKFRQSICNSILIEWHPFPYVHMTYRSMQSYNDLHINTIKQLQNVISIHQSYANFHNIKSYHEHDMHTTIQWTSHHYKIIQWPSYHYKHTMSFTPYNHTMTFTSLHSYNDLYILQSCNDLYMTTIIQWPSHRNNHTMTFTSKQSYNDLLQSSMTFTSYNDLYMTTVIQWPSHRNNHTVTGTSISLQSV